MVSEDGMPQQTIETATIHKHPESIEEMVGKDETAPRKESLVLGELADLRALREESGRKNQFREATSNVLEHFKYHIHIVKKKPQIAIYSLLIFGALCACGLSIVFIIAKKDNEANQLQALDLASETGQWFCKSWRQMELA